MSAATGTKLQEELVRCGKAKTCCNSKFIMSAPVRNLFTSPFSRSIQRFPLLPASTATTCVPGLSAERTSSLPRSCERGATGYGLIPDLPRCADAPRRLSQALSVTPLRHSPVCQNEAVHGLAGNDGLRSSAVNEINQCALRPDW